MIVKLAIFDLDGTLIDSVDDLARAINWAREAYGLAPLTHDVVAGYVGNGVAKLIERSFAGSSVNLDEARQCFCGQYDRCMTEQTRPYPGVVEGLKRLRAEGWRLAVVSNKHAPAVRAILDRFELSSVFDQVLGGGDTQRIKPDPEPMHRVMGQMGARPAHTWVIGDHWTDLDAAQAAGAHGLFVTYGIGRMEGRLAEMSCDSFPAVVAALLAWAP